MRQKFVVSSKCSDFTYSILIVVIMMMLVTYQCANNVKRVDEKESDL